MIISTINAFDSIDCSIIKSKECLIFDMDGTLIQTENLNYMVYKSVLKELFNVLISKDDWKVFFSGRRPQDSIKQYLTHKGLPSFTFEMTDFVNIAKPLKEDLVFNHIKENSFITKGASEFLETMTEQKKTIILCSSTIRIFCISILKQYNLYKFFDYILTAEDVANGKPSPEIYIKAHKLSNHPKEECIVFEDSISGIESAKLAGIDIIRIINSF